MSTELVSTGGQRRSGREPAWNRSRKAEGQKSGSHRGRPTANDTLRPDCRQAALSTEQLFSIVTILSSCFKRVVQPGFRHMGGTCHAPFYLLSSFLLQPPDC